jgi:CubicO group peptidase (beta-lactamase class C family)
VAEGYASLQEEERVALLARELAGPRLLRSPHLEYSALAESELAVVAAARAITLADLLTSRAGYGFPSDFSLPAVELLYNEVQKYGRDPRLVAPPEEWMAALSRIPLLHQPGDAWLYNTCSDIQGVLIARVSGRPFPEFLAERLFQPLGMVGTGFELALLRPDVACRRDRRRPPTVVATPGMPDHPGESGALRAGAGCSPSSPDSTVVCSLGGPPASSGLSKTRM